MHADQLAITKATVRRLVDDQFPPWRDLPIAEVSSAGTVNALFRLGPDLVARFPLRPGPVSVVRSELVREAERAAELAGRTSVPTPRPMAIGEPGAAYPLPWSVQTWLLGTVAFVDDPGSSYAFAHDLAGFVTELRMIDTRGRVFAGTNRGGDLRSHDDWMATCLDRSGHLFEVTRLRRLWAGLRDLPRRAPDVMSHHDLIGGNVLVDGGRLVGVLDVGGFGPADPALDLVAAWHLLEAGPRQAFRDDLRSDELEWQRGRAWAFEQAMGAAWYYESSNPAMHAMGCRTIERLLAAEG